MTTRLPHPHPPSTLHPTHYLLIPQYSKPSFYTKILSTSTQHLQDLDLRSLASPLHLHYHLLWDWLAFVLLRVELWALGMLSTGCTTEPPHPPQHTPRLTDL